MLAYLRYGQTGSGKTFTMMGPPNILDTPQSKPAEPEPTPAPAPTARGGRRQARKKWGPPPAEVSCSLAHCDERHLGALRHSGSVWSLACFRDLGEEDA